MSRSGRAARQGGSPCAQGRQVDLLTTGEAGHLAEDGGSIGRQVPSIQQPADAQAHQQQLPAGRCSGPQHAAPQAALECCPCKRARQGSLQFASLNVPGRPAATKSLVVIPGQLAARSCPSTLPAGFSVVSVLASKSAIRQSPGATVCEDYARRCWTKSRTCGGLYAPAAYRLGKRSACRDVAAAGSAGKYGRYPAIVVAMALSCIMAVRAAMAAAEHAPPRAALAAAAATPADAAVMAPFLLQIRRLLTPERLLRVWPLGLVSPRKNLPPLHDLLPALLLMATLWELRLATAPKRMFWLHACQLALPPLVCSGLPHRPEQACNGCGMVLRGKT